MTTVRRSPQKQSTSFRFGAATEPVLSAVVLLVVGLVLVACGDPTRPAGPSVEPGPPLFTHGNFTRSTGRYRIPYADGTVLAVWQDHHTHGDTLGSSRDRIDLNAGTGTPIVAAAGGWIRFVRDHNGNSFGRGDGLAWDSLTAQADSLEHACGNRSPNNPGDPPNPIFGTCGQHNNYVWIEHPNGEWTKYTHFSTGTVTINNGWQVDDWVDANEVLGLEDDIGQATGTPSASHLHYEVAVPDDPTAVTLPLTSVETGFINQNLATNLVPRVCDDDGNVFLYAQNDTLTANQCDHLPPVADPGGPYDVDEGTSLPLDGTNSSDPEGRPLAYRWRPDVDLSDSTAILSDSTIAEPTFVAGTSMVVDLALIVYDQWEALDDSNSTTITVNNVDPTVTIDPSQVTVIEEGETVTVLAEFTDPGYLDTHTVTVDWGVPAELEGIEIAPPTIQVLEAGGPDEPLRGRVTGTYRYGDNDAGADFTIEITVTDSDGGSGSASFDLTVNNVDPVAAIDLSGEVLLNGMPTVVASAGDEVTLSGLAEDPGSDDVTLTWDWDDGTIDSRLSLVNPPLPDPLPSPTVQARTEPDQVGHAFADACLYEVGFSVTDDDGGDGAATADVIIVGNADQVRGAGYWTSEYRFVKNPDFTPATLACYLDIVNHASAVFSEHRSLASVDGAVDILWVRGTSEADDLFDRQLITAWLNLANGAYTLDQPVDTTDDGVADSVYLEALVQAEELRVDPARTRPALLAMKDILEQLSTVP